MKRPNASIQTMRRSLPFVLAIIGFTLIWYSQLISAVLAPRVITPARIEAATQAEIANNTLVYPALGITAPVTVSPATSPLDSTDWGKIREALGRGVSLAFAGADFNSAPLAFVTGHSSDTFPHPYSSIFAGLGQAKAGDILLINVSGTVYRYQVTDIQIIAPTNINAFESLSPTDGSHRLALVTCWPVLTTKNRLVVLATRI